jgi:glycosyltransferase involved in cell wall biosynthesis
MEPTYSVIVPVFNEEGNIRTLHAEIVAAMRALGEPFEVLFINDGSSDGTRQELDTLSPLVAIHFRKNFGQTAAMDAGFKQARGRYFITLDGDGQNPPSEIPKLVAAMKEQNVDIVSGWRAKRKDPLLKKFVSRGAYLLRSLLVKDGIHDSGCSLKMYKRECFKDVDLHGEMHRFIPAVLSWQGFTIGEVAVEHRPRLHGTSKYNWKRIVKGFIDMVAILFWRRYASRPLHLFGGLGLLLIAGGGALGVALGVMKFGFGQPLAESNLPLLAVLMIVLGAQFFVSGILADVIMRQYYRAGHTAYAIAEVTRRTDPDSVGQ